MPNSDVKLIATDPPAPQINSATPPVSLPKILQPSPAPQPPPTAIPLSAPPNSKVQMNSQTGYGVKTMIPPLDPFDKARMLNPALRPKPMEKLQDVKKKFSNPVDPKMALPPKPPLIKSYSYKSKAAPSRLAWVILAIFLFLSLSGFGVYYFIKNFNLPSGKAVSSPVLNLTPEQTGSNNTGSSAKTAVANQVFIAPDKGFGPLPAPDLSAYLLQDLKLKGSVVANEVLPTNEIPKVSVYLKINNQGLAPASASFSKFFAGVFFSKDYKVASDSANLTEEEFLKITDPNQKSNYPVKNESQALSDVVSDNIFYGITAQKIDWKKYSLKSWQVVSFNLVYFSSGDLGDKYVMPIYVFEGKAKIKGVADGKIIEVNLKLFTSALSN